MSCGFGIVNRKIKDLSEDFQYEGCGVFNAWEPTKWEELPAEILKAKNVAQFKRACNKLILTGKMDPNPRTYTPSMLIFWWRGKLWRREFFKRTYVAYKPRR